MAGDVGRLRLSVARVMTIDSLGQETFPAALTAPGKSGTSAFGSHSGAETVLPLASSL